MRVGSLFSGAGGLDLAVEAVFGGEVIWQCEVDKAAAKVLAYRFPCAPNLGDITAVDWRAVEPPDVLCGGFPCQDVSAAGKRAGIKDGTRSGLWAVFADAIDILRPPIVIIENVRGLLSAAAHRNVEPADPTVGDRPDGPVLRAAGAVLGDLADLGYDSRWATVAAADVGAPHRRERVFIVAADADEGRRGGRWKASRGDVGGHNEIDGRWRGESPAGRCGPASHSSRIGWGERRPEPVVGGFDAAVSGDADGRVELLPTPTAQSAKHSGDSRFGGGNGDASNLWQIHHLLLPKPTSRDHKGRNQRDDDTCLQGALLPTPRNRDGKGATSSRSGDNKHDLPSALADQDLTGLLRAQGNADDTGKPPSLGPVSQLETGWCEQCWVEYESQSCVCDEFGYPVQSLLPTLSPCSPFCVCGGTDAVAHHELLCTPSASDGAGGKTAWGKYEPAIRRWESLTRPAPAPTEPNKNGNPRLSAAFSEWLMGWPDGWVTDPDIGISRNDQLRIIGNGVCPQQAAAALRYLLSVREVVA